MTQLVAFTGYAQVGKSLAASIAARLLGGVDCAVADSLNDVLYAQNPIVMMPLNDGGDPVRLQELVDEVGFEDAKKLWPEVRELQKGLGNAVRDNIDPNIWIGKTIVDALKGGKPTAISGIRFSNESLAVKQYGGNIVRIHRPGYVAESDFEKEVDVLPYDFRIYNNGTVDQLEAAVRVALTCLNLLPDVDRTLVAVNDEFNRQAREISDRRLAEKAAAAKAVFEKNGGNRNDPMPNPYRVDL